MTATEELRHLLDERGVRWRETRNSCDCEFTWWESPTFGKVRAMDNGDGTLFMPCLNNCDFTPKQAITATLGKGKCQIKHVKSGAMYDVWKCSVCGYEYAESVSDESIVQNFCPNCGREVADV